MDDVLIILSFAPHPAPRYGNIDMILIISQSANGTQDGGGHGLDWGPKEDRLPAF